MIPVIRSVNQVSILEIIFWLSCFLLIYTVALYPFFLLLLGLMRKREVVRDNISRKVALIIPVNNGEKEIDAKLRNCLALEYPRDMMDIHVVSDGSTDRTVEIVNSYASQGVHCLALPKRVGKVAAQNQVLPHVKADILVFTDVGILVPPTALKDIVSNFADESIGVVSCRDEIVSHENSHGDSLYIRYDMAIRKCAAGVGSLIGVTGGFYAVRHEIADGGWEPAFPPDFYVALRALKMGYRVVEDSRVTARYYTPASDSRELERKVRTITRGMSAFFANLSLLNVFKYPLVAVQLLSHKLLRWISPILLMICFTTSGILALRGEVLFQVLFALQIFLLGTGALLAFVSWKKNVTSKIYLVPRLFFMFSFAILLSWKNFLTGKRIVLWQPTVRNS